MIVKGGFALELKNWIKTFRSVEAECRTVLDTLEMYHALQVSYNNLHDKSGLTQHRLQFAGYCAAREKKSI